MTTRLLVRVMAAACAFFLARPTLAQPTLAQPTLPQAVVPSPLRSDYVVPVDAGKACSNIAEIAREIETKYRIAADILASSQSKQKCQDIGFTAAYAFCTRAPEATLVTIPRPEDVAFAERSLFRFLQAAETLQAAEASISGKDASEQTAARQALTEAKTQAAGELCSEFSDKSEAVVGVGVTSVALGDAVVRGLAQFVSARLKAELARALEQKLSKQLCTGAAKEVFRSTCQVLEVRKAADGPQQNWGLLKAAMEEDWQRFPQSALRVIAQQTGHSGEQWAQVSIAILPQLVTFLQSIRDGEDILQLLNGLKAPYENDDLNCSSGSSARCVLLILSVAGEALAGDLPTKPDDLETYALIALRKMSEHPKLVFLAEPMHAEQRVDGVLAMRDGLARITRLAKKEKLDEATAAAIIRSSADLLKGAALVWAKGTPADPACGGHRTVMECAVWISERSRTVANLVNHTSARNYAAALATSIELANELEVSEDLPAWLVSYAGFAAELASVKDGDSAQQVIEAAAMPVGSYENKRQYGNIALTLTALPGAGAGLEWLTSSNLDMEDSRSTHAGMFAPVGLDLSLGLGKGYSIGVFLSALNLGTLVDYRLDDEDVEADDGSADVETEPEVGFAQTVSPGAYLEFGLFDLPLVVGAGASYVPALRNLEITPEDPASPTSGSTSSVVRFSAFVAVDVSILPVVP